MQLCKWLWNVPRDMKTRMFYRAPAATTIFCSTRLSVLSRTKQNIFTLKKKFLSVTSIMGNTSYPAVFPSARQKLYNTDDLEDKLQKIQQPLHLVIFIFHFPNRISKYKDIIKGLKWSTCSSNTRVHMLPHILYRPCVF